MKKTKKVLILLLFIIAASVCFAGTQFPGQPEGQAAAVANTLSDTGVRTFSGENLGRINYPLAGMGTGIIYFNGGAVPTRWDIGILSDPLLMTLNSLFAIRVNNGGTIVTKKLQAPVSQAFDNQPTASTRSGGMNKQGTYYIGTCELAPYTSWDDSKTGILESNSFVMPAACTKITALIGGGNDINNEYLALVDANTGAVLVKLTGDNNEAMVTKTMNIGTAYSGRSVKFAIVDMAIGGWGHINVDNIRLLNSSNGVVSSTFTNGDFETGNLTGWSKIGSGNFANEVVTLEYPIAKYKFTDPGVIVDAELEMFSPMVPLNERDSIIPTGVFTVKLTNKAANQVQVSVLSSLANGLMGTSKTNTGVSNTNGTYVTMTSAGFQDGTMQEGSLSVWTNASGATFCAGAAGAGALISQINSTGSLNGATSGNASNPVAGVCAPLTLNVGETKSVSFTWSWYFPHMLGSNIWGTNNTDVSRRYVNYYSNVTAVMTDVKNRWSDVVDKTRLYHDTIYDSNLPYYFIDAVTANSDILRSPTMFVLKNGEVYGWEGSDGVGGSGCCIGNCMHVWNYAETLANLYPELARRWKNVDFTRQQLASGLLNNRIGAVPAPTTPSGEGVAIDGTLGTIAGAYREHLNSPDNAFLDGLWTRIRNAMNGAINTWDPNRDGLNENTANTTFDGPVYGTNSFVAAQYLAALRAAEEMAKIKGDTASATTYHNLYVSGSSKLSNQTYNGEYFYQVGAGEYGAGMMADHLLGQSHAFQYGLGYLLPKGRVFSSVNSVFKYNFLSPMGNHYLPEWGDPLRVMAKPDDDGLLICTFPNGGSGTAYYLDEDWPGFDYEVASQLLYLGNVNQALAIIHAVRKRQDGKDFDPLNERECGGYYARSLSSYGIMVAATGIEKNGPQKMLGFKPNYKPENIKAFFTNVNGWGIFEQTRSVAGNVTTQIDKISVKYGSQVLRTLQFYYPETLQNVTNVAATVKVNGVTTAATQIVTGNQVKLTFGSDTTVNTGGTVEVTINVTSGLGLKSNLTGWAPVNGTWTDTIEGKQGTGTGDNFILAAESGTNFTYEADIKVTTNNPTAGALVFRSASNPLNGSYVCNIDTGIGGRIHLFKFPYVFLGSYTVPITVGSTYHLKVAVSGSNIKVYFNNGTDPVINVNDTSYASGRFGLNIWNGTAMFQNVSKSSGFVSSGLTGWTTVTGTWADTIEGKQGTGTGDNFVLAAESGTNFTYEADLKTTTNNPTAAALIFRSGSNPATASYACNIDTGTNVVKLFKFPYAVLATYAVPIYPNTVYHLKVVTSGANIKVYFNYGASPVININDSSYASGRFGLNTWSGTGVIQNISMQPDTVQPPSNIVDNDNGAPGYTTTGTWTTSTGTGYNGGTYQYVTAGTSNTATWNLSIPSTGSYTISVIYKSGTNRATSTKYNVATASGTQTVYINQTLNDLAWVTLGTWNFNAGNAAVTLDSAGSSGGTSPVVIADAVKFDQATSYNNVIVDNDTGAPGYTVTGAWSTTATGGYNNGSYQYATAGTAKTAIWAPNLPGAGTWRVSVIYRSGTNRATSAKFNVATASGTQTVYVNQTTNNLTWVTLGTWSFNAGGGNVTLDAAGSSGGTSPVVIADTIRWEFVSL